MIFFKDKFSSILLIGLCATVMSSSFAHSNDPLSTEEIEKASSLTSPQRVAAKLTGSTGSTVKLQEVLLIERHAEKGAPKGQRRADVFTYDYQTDELIQSLVDLNTSEVLSTSRKQGVQLPLTDNELKRAKQIIFNNEDERQILEHEYQRITSKPLTDTSELYIKAFSFVAASLPNIVNEASKKCGIHRCAQLMLYTGENIVFEITPIVDLSEGVVTQRIGF